MAVIAASDRRPPLDEQVLTGEVGVTPGLSLELLRETASTNQIAADRAREGAPDGLLVVGDHQTAGRGRLDRTWETPAGAAVTFSLVLRPTVPAASWPWLPLLAGYTVSKALAALGYDAKVKWPNDVLVASTGPEPAEWGKVAGILVERIDTRLGPAAVVGIGINVSTTLEELPVPTATSLAVAHPDLTPTREGVLLATVVALREAYDAWQAGGPEATSRLAASYAAHCATIGQEVRVELPGGTTLHGRAVDVDADGRLVVDTGSGRESVGAGDVVHVVPE